MLTTYLQKLSLYLHFPSLIPQVILSDLVLNVWGVRIGGNVSRAKAVLINLGVPKNLLIHVSYSSVFLVLAALNRMRCGSG
jgi:hypothetical protein